MTECGTRSMFEARQRGNTFGRWVREQFDKAGTETMTKCVESPLRERVAKAIYARRYKLDPSHAESMFAWYAESPNGTDASRMAIYSALEDADAALAVIHGEQLNPAKESK